MSNDGLSSCAKHDGYIIGCVECLRAHLDRKPPDSRWTWGDWFTFDGEYLGIRLARTGPDAVDTKQRCDCDVCAKGRVVRGAPFDEQMAAGHA